MLEPREGAHGCRVPHVRLETTNLFTAHWPCNVGLIVSEGHVVVEADSTQGDEELQSLSPLPTVTRAARPGRGRALLFAVDLGVLPRSGAHLGQSRNIDVIGPGGMLVAPPSRHATGHVYAWAANLGPSDLGPARLPEKLVGLVSRTKDQPRPAAEIDGAGPSLELLLGSDLAFNELWNGRGKQGGDESASGYDFAVSRYLGRQLWTVEQIAAALPRRPGVHSTAAEYCQRTATAAVSRKQR